MAVEAFEKLKSSINRSVTAINEKKASNQEKAKLKAQMDILNNDAQRMLTAVGEAVYLMWQKEDNDLSKLHEYLEIIKQKKAQAAALAEEIAAIDERSNSVLDNGNAGASTTPNVMANDTCANCGTPYPAGAKFCRTCGNKLTLD